MKVVSQQMNESSINTFVRLVFPYPKPPVDVQRCLLKNVAYLLAVFQCEAEIKMKLLDDPVIVFMPLFGENCSFDLPKALQQLRPKHIVMYDYSLVFMRQLEVDELFLSLIF